MKKDELTYSGVGAESDNEDDESIQLTELDKLAWGILSRGDVAGFNAFRQEHPDFTPSLDGFYGNTEAQNLDGVNLSGASLKDAVFTKCSLKGASFVGADLRRANLAGADLTGTDFTDAIMERAWLNGTWCESTLFVRAQMRDSILRMAKNIDSDLTGADTVNVDFCASRGFV